MLSLLGTRSVHLIEHGMVTSLNQSMLCRLRRVKDEVVLIKVWPAALRTHTDTRPDRTSTSLSLQLPGTCLCIHISAASNTMNNALHCSTILNKVEANR